MRYPSNAMYIFPNIPYWLYLKKKKDDSTLSQFTYIMKNNKDKNYYFVLNDSIRL